jgi:AMP nucleosidase
MPLLPPFVAPARFTSADAALARVREIYDSSVGHLRNALQAFVNGEARLDHVRGFYPFLRVHTDTVARADSRLSYGFVAGPGTFETTLTRPDLFAGYYLEQFRCCSRITASSSRSAPACSRSRCTSRSPSTTTSKAA